MCRTNCAKIVRRNIRRIVRKQLKDARTALCDESATDSLDERVHSARKGFKRVRAVVRLVRNSIGDSNYRIENESLRDAGRPLSKVRDAKVLLDTLDKLKSLSGDSVADGAFASVERKLTTHKLHVLKTVVRNENAFEETADAVDQALSRLRDWSRIQGDWKAVRDGVKCVYRRGRKAFDEVKIQPTVGNLHEWRKQVKYLRHQMELLGPIWPEVVGELAVQAEELGELLGEDHDLAVLRAYYLNRNDDADDHNLDVITALIDSRREALQKEAIPKGELLYRDRPKQFVRRLKSYWRKWEKRSRDQAAVA